MENQLCSRRLQFLHHRCRRKDDLTSAGAIFIVFVVTAAVFYMNAHWVLRRWADLLTIEFDRLVMQQLSHAAAVMLLIAAWTVKPSLRPRTEIPCVDARSACLERATWRRGKFLAVTLSLSISVQLLIDCRSRQTPLVLPLRSCGWRESSGHYSAPDMDPQIGL